MTRRGALATGSVLAVTLALGVAFAQAGPDVPPAPERAAASTPTGMAAGLRELASDLGARERSLDRREASIAAREGDLVAIQERLDARLVELQALRDEISGMLQGLDTEDESRIADLVRKVEVMRPKQAGEVLAVTEPRLAVEVLRRMQPSKAGKALAAMPAPIAAVLAEQMAAADPVPAP